MSMIDCLRVEGERSCSPKTPTRGKRFFIHKVNLIGSLKKGGKSGETSKDKLFNARDIKKVTDRIDNPDRKRNHYFHEWKAAIALLKKYDLLSLVGQYSATGSAHRNKVEIVRQRVSDDVWEAINKPVLDAGKAAGLPDLFVYHRDNENEWFFAEVKGQNATATGLKDDKISDAQEAKSKLLDEAAGKCVSLLIELKRTTKPFTPTPRTRPPNPRPR